MAMILAIHVRHSQAIIEETDVEPALFEHACDVLIVLGRVAVRARIGMAPGSGQSRAILRLQEGDEMDLAHVHPKAFAADAGLAA